MKVLNITLIITAFLVTGLYPDSTSLSDNGSFPTFCQLAALSPSSFAQFRKGQPCCQIVETVSAQEGFACLEIVKKQSPDFLNYKDVFVKGDKVGGPHTYFYPEMGHLSPTTLRYIKVASDFVKHFGTLNDLTIVEIGGGYGGQCKIIADLFKCKHYIIIDIPSSLALTKKFLHEQGVTNVTFLTPNDPLPTENIDLVISNYAYSELVTDLRKNYLDKVLRHARNGYMICNLDHAFDPKSEYANKSTLLSELIGAHIPFKVLDEVPKTGPDNYLVVWTKK